MDIPTKPHSSSITTKYHEPLSTTSSKFVTSNYCRDPEPSHRPFYPRETREQIDAGPSSSEPNFLTTLPPEIIYRILSHMQPEEYAGLAMTCRLALEVTNNQVQVERPNLVWLYFPSHVSDIYFSEHVSLAGASKAMRDFERTFRAPICSLGVDADFEEDEGDL